jgi:hypothetical protein
MAYHLCICINPLWLWGSYTIIHFDPYSMCSPQRERVYPGRIFTSKRKDVFRRLNYWTVFYIYIFFARVIQTCNYFPLHMQRAGPMKP